MDCTIHAGRDIRTGGFALYIYQERRDRREDHMLLGDEGYTKHEPGDYAEASAYLSKHEAQRLVSELWAAGVRPEDWGTEGQVQALSAHLEDMRTLVFKEKPAP
jgi:hypothetical protein